MNVRHAIGDLHSFSIKNIFYDKMDLRLFYFDVTISQLLRFSVLLINIFLQPRMRPFFLSFRSYKWRQINE